MQAPLLLPAETAPPPPINDLRPRNKSDERIWLAVLLLTLLMDTFPTAYIANEMTTRDENSNQDCFFKKLTCLFALAPLVGLPSIYLRWRKTIQQRDRYLNIPAEVAHNLGLDSTSFLNLKGELFQDTGTKCLEVIWYFAIRIIWLRAMPTLTCDVGTNISATTVLYPLLILATLPLAYLASLISHPYRARGKYLASIFGPGCGYSGSIYLPLPVEAYQQQQQQNTLDDNHAPAPTVVVEAVEMMPTPQTRTI